jgi:hypothetical protein
MGGSPTGTSMRISRVSARKLSSGRAANGVNASPDSAARLISATPPRQRQTRSGFNPMME